MALVVFLVVVILRGQSQGETPTQAIGSSVTSAGESIKGGFATAWDKVVFKPMKTVL